MDATENLLRGLPAIDRVLQTRAATELRRRWQSPLIDAEVRAVVDERRRGILDGEVRDMADAEALASEAGRRLARRFAPGYPRCINATGVVLHTGLGRAALPPSALEAIQREAAGYTVVSVDREEGLRRRRESTIASLLCALTGAEAATMVNNNAAATLISLNTLAAGREAILSRGQLVEIGGSFRMPDVFAAAGVKLREVGTTNRTHLADYRAAITEETGLLLRVHPSNYKVIGFTTEVPLADLVPLGREFGIPVMDDLGAGALVPLPPEPRIADSMRLGADLLTCSGDKLIGGPQAGLILGSREWVDRIRGNPLFRTLRVDKLALIAMEATLRLFLQPGGPGDAHPTLRMLHLGREVLARRAEALAKRIAAAAPGLATDLRADFSRVGSGSLPGESLPTTLVTLEHADRSAARFARDLRLANPPVYTRIVDDRVCLDPRTLQEGEEETLIHVLGRLSS